jgi:hypothetical protein
MRQLLDRVGTTLDPSITPLIESVRATAHQLTGTATDYDGLLELIDEARFVLIGRHKERGH